MKLDVNEAKVAVEFLRLVSVTILVLGMVGVAAILR
jgi:hypothetical protein